MFTPRRLHYFSYDLNREVIELYWNTALYNLALNLTYIFEPIFLYNLGFNLVQIMSFYLVVYVCYATFIIPITKITSKIGYKHAIFISSFIYVGYWIFLYQIKFHPNLFYIAPIWFALQKSFYWPPYNADVSIHNVKAQRGREIGLLFSLVELVAIVGPIIGGFISFQFGFIMLFTSASVLMLASVYPLFRSPEIYPRHEFQFRNFWMIMKKYPRNFFGYWGYAEDLMLMSLWPIFMFLIVPQIFSIGAIITFASFIAIMLMLYLGRLIDRFKKINFLPIGAVFYGLTWLFRWFSPTLAGIVSFDILTRLGKAMVNVPMLSKTFEIAGSKGPDLAIAYNVFFEFSLSIGKIITALASIWILKTTGSITDVFLLVGVVTMLYSLIRK